MQQHRWRIGHPVTHLQVRAHVGRPAAHVVAQSGFMGRPDHCGERAEIVQPERVILVAERVDRLHHVGGREAADHVLHRIAFIGIGAVLIPRIVGGQPHQQRRVAAGRRAPDTETVGVHVPLARVCPEIADGCFDVLEICGEHVVGGRSRHRDDSPWPPQSLRGPKPRAAGSRSRDAAWSRRCLARIPRWGSGGHRHRRWIVVR